MNRADFAWIPSVSDVWELARIVEHNTGNIRVCRDDDSEGDYSLHEVRLADPSHLVDQDDLCKVIIYMYILLLKIKINEIQVNDLHDAPLLGILRKRYLNGQIYTDIGRVLISINPYSNISELYNDPLSFLSVHNDYRDIAPFSRQKPHIFKIANDSLRMFFDQQHLSTKIDQSIIISGESGSGKTEASKLVMHFLIQADNKMKPSMNADISSENIGVHIKTVLTESNYILESFGNAKTIR